MNILIYLPILSIIISLIFFIRGIIYGIQDRENHDIEKAYLNMTLSACLFIILTVFIYYILLCNNNKFN